TAPVDGISQHTLQPQARRASLLAGRWAPLPVVLAGTFMVVLDFFIVNVALPSMQSDLHASDGAIEWVVAGYALTSAVLLITAGRLGDQFGRRKVFSVGLALFTLASLECGIAGSAQLLVAARLLQGAAAAILMPNTSLFAQRSFSAGLLTQFTFWGGQASFFLVLALYLQAGRGLSAMTAGLVFTILAASYLAASMVSEGLLARFGPRVLAAGALTLATGHALRPAAVADVAAGGSIAPLVPGLLVVGAGMGL